MQHVPNVCCPATAGWCCLRSGRAAQAKARPGRRRRLRCAGGGTGGRAAVRSPPGAHRGGGRHCGPGQPPQLPWAGPALLLPALHMWAAAAREGTPPPAQRQQAQAPVPDVAVCAVGGAALCPAGPVRPAGLLCQPATQGRWALGPGSRRGGPTVGRLAGQGNWHHLCARPSARPWVRVSSGSSGAKGWSGGGSGHAKQGSSVECCCLCLGQAGRLG